MWFVQKLHKVISLFAQTVTILIDFYRILINLVLSNSNTGEIQFLEIIKKDSQKFVIKKKFDKILLLNFLIDIFKSNRLQTETSAFISYEIFHDSEIYFSHFERFKHEKWRFKLKTWRFEL